MNNVNEIILIEIYSILVRVESNNKNLLERIRKDFSFFISTTERKSDISISSFYQKIPMKDILQQKPDRQSKICKSFDEGKIRFNFYDDKLLSRYDFSKEEGRLYSEDINLLHEKSYLLILSRVGKILDLRGLHRIHGMGISLNKTALIFTMNSGGGKSTLLRGLLKREGIKLLSDDTPLMNNKGEILPFPLRMGFEETCELPFLEDKNFYQLKRQEYGLKYLASVEDLSLEIGRDYDQLIFVNGKRGGSSKCLIMPSSAAFSYLKLFIHSFVGIGLPIILEYFWENGFKDFLVKTKIFLLRMKAGFYLVSRAKHYEAIIGYDKTDNEKEILKLIKN